MLLLIEHTLRTCLDIQRTIRIIDRSLLRDSSCVNLIDVLRSPLVLGRLLLGYKKILE